MIDYPVSIPRKSYSGKSSRNVAAIRRFNVVAGIIEDRINERASDEDEVMVTVGEIIGELDPALVRDVLGTIGEGENGITVRKAAA